MKEIPEIRISYSYLLQDGISRKLDSYEYPNESRLSTHEQAESYAAAYRREWAKYEELILAKMTSRLGLSYYKSVIDVNLADYFIPQSQPIIMHFRNEPDEFVDVLTHELIHVLLTDNERYQSFSSDFDLLAEWGQIFGKHDFNTLVHIPVHAIAQHVYLDVLGEPRRLERDISNANKKGREAYREAWGYVRDQDHNEIIDQVAEIYSVMSNS